MIWGRDKEELLKLKKRVEELQQGMDHMYKKYSEAIEIIEDREKALMRLQDEFEQYKHDHPVDPDEERRQAALAKQWEDLLSYTGANKETNHA